MLPAIFAIVGIFIGGAIEGDEGAVFGFVTGLLVGLVFTLRRRIVSLERDTKRLESRLQALETELTPIELDMDLAAQPSSDSASASQPNSVSTSNEVPRPEVPSSNLANSAFLSDAAVSHSDGMSVGSATTELPSDRAATAPEADEPPRAASQDGGWATGLVLQLSRSFKLALDWLRGGNPIVRVGVVVLFFGIAFALKLAVDGGLVPVELRLAGIGAFGVALLAFGWRLRRRSTNFALPVQGGGAGVLFLTVFAAHGFYGFISAEFAFALLVVMVLLTAALAVAQGSPALAALGVTGGFLAPILVSTGSGNHVGLFGYYLVLNLLVVSVSWFNAWRSLNLVGFFFTFGVSTLWGSKFYKPELFASTEPFLVAFALIYTAVAVLFALRQPPNLRGLVDGTLVFGTPLVAFGLQTQLLKGDSDAIALSAVIASAFYIVLAAVCLRWQTGRLKSLGEAFVANGIIFATLAVPLGLDARWTAATWAIEGAGVLWVGVRQGRIVPRVLGVVLQFLAGVALASDLRFSSSLMAFANSEFLGALIIITGGLFSATYLRIHADKCHRFEQWGAAALALWAFSWWWGSLFVECFSRRDEVVGWAVFLGLWGASTFAFVWASNRLNWAVFQVPQYALLIVMLLGAPTMAVITGDPWEEMAWLGWPLVVAFYFVGLRILEARPHKSFFVLHGTPLWLFVFLGMWSLEALLSDWAAAGDLWSKTALGLMLALVVALSVRGFFARRWPLNAWRGAYLGLGAGPLIIAAGLWLYLVVIDYPSDNWPMDYLPLVNPIDISAGFLLLATLMWLRACARHFGDRWIFAARPYMAAVMLGAAAFWHANGIILRTAHYWGDIPYDPRLLLGADVVQTAFAVFWGLTGLIGMAWSARRGSRGAWFSAAALMAVVVVKLFVVDLANVGTVEGVVSFVSVGIALVAVGYFAPLPPRKASVEAE